MEINILKFNYLQKIYWEIRKMKLDEKFLNEIYLYRLILNW
jgi:hypothetical protein